MSYQTHQKFRTNLRKIKRVNSAAKVIGLDIGRKYTGISITDSKISIAKPLRTLVGNPMYEKDTIDLKKSDGVFSAIR